MRRSLNILFLVCASAATLVPAALGVPGHVRVEGRTTTIFGPADPRFEAGANPLEALEAASVRGEFYYELKQFPFGPFVTQIGRYAASGTAGWAFKVNGASPGVGADKVVLKDGDRVLWYWAEFGPAGGPPTLLLRRDGRNCYRVSSQNDQGRTTAAAGAVLRVDSRSVRTKAGRGCVGRHRGLVRATLTGAVRSNVLS